jgi:predicted permease
MTGVALVALCLLVGWALRACGRVRDDAAGTLSRVVVDVALPCLTFRAMRSLHPDGAVHAWGPALAAYIAFLAGLGALSLAARMLRWDRPTTGTVLVTATVGNTAFVGLPLIEGLFGPDALPTAMQVDQGGSFVLVSTASVLLAGAYGGRGRSLRAALGAMARFPPLIGSGLGLASRGWPLPAWANLATERLAALVVPLALLSVGMRLRFDRHALARDRGPLLVGLWVKLALAPAAALVFTRSIGLDPRERAVTVAQCAMAPMVTAAIVATEHGLRAELASALVAVGAVASLATVPLWAWLMRAGGL